MNQSLRTLRRRQPLAALAAVLVLALAARPIQAAGPGLTGYVFALDEKGKIIVTVPGAALEFQGAEVVKATANKNGLYRVDLRAGTYTYKLTAAGFKAEDVGRTLTTGGGDGYQVKNFGLSPGTTDPTQKGPSIPAVAGGILQGDVVEKTADGKDVQIPGATVYLRNKAGKSPLGQAMTRSHDDTTKPGQRRGHYELELAAGAYAASVVAAGFDRFKQAEPVTIVVGKTATQRFVLTRAVPPEPNGQGIEGTVKFADPGKAAAALPPITISIVPVGRSDRPAATFNPDPNRGFQRNLLEGRYRLEFKAKGYRSYPLPIPDVCVLGGSYTAKGLSAGSYTVQVSMKGYKAASPPPTFVLNKNDSHEIVLTADTPATPPNTFDLVVVASSGGQPVSDAECTVKRAGKTVVSGMSDASGSYTAAGLDAGFYVVQMTKNGLTANKSVTHYKNDRVEITLAASPPPPPPTPVDPSIELVTVPNVTGSMETVVRSTLTAAGLKEEFTGNPNLGPAQHQNYRAGMHVKPGTTVVVYFPEPPKPPDPGPTPPPPPALVTVPDLTGASESVVQSTLAAVDLKEEFTGKPSLGPVKAQNYPLGSKVKPGTTIVVSFPETPPPPALITVTSV